MHRLFLAALLFHGAFSVCPQSAAAEVLDRAILYSAFKRVPTAVGTEVITGVPESIVGHAVGSVRFVESQQPTPLDPGYAFFPANGSVNFLMFGNSQASESLTATFAFIPAGSRFQTVFSSVGETGYLMRFSVSPREVVFTLGNETGSVKRYALSQPHSTTNWNRVTLTIRPGASGGTLLSLDINGVTLTRTGGDALSTRFDPTEHRQWALGGITQSDYFVGRISPIAVFAGELTPGKAAKYLASIANANFFDVSNARPQPAKDRGIVTSPLDIQEHNPYPEITEIAAPSVQSSGVATLHYPIKVPPGIKELQPQLSLTYAGSPVPGDAGLGWNLNGISKIVLDTRDGLRAYRPYRPYRYFEEDGTQFRPDRDSRNVPLLLDGNELVQQDFNTFRFKAEQNFFRVQLLRTGGFVVQTPDGVQRYYGTTANSRLSDPSDPNYVAVWSIDRLVDAHGNQLRFTYMSNSTTEPHALYPQKIEYGYDPTRALYAHEVRFTWQNRPDYRVHGRQGFLVRDSYRLRAINVRSNGKDVKRYLLQHTVDGYGRSLLISVKEYSANNRLLNNHSMAYLAQADISSNGSDFSDLTDLPVNWLHLSAFHEYQQELNLLEHTKRTPDDVSHESRGLISLLDINGDGLPDRVSTRYDSSALDVGLNNGNGFDIPVEINQDFLDDQRTDENCNIVWGAPAPAHASLRYSKWENVRLDFLDVNGDNLLDRVYRNILPGEDATTVLVNTGNGFVSSRNILYVHHPITGTLAKSRIPPEVDPSGEEREGEEPYRHFLVHNLHADADGDNRIDAMASNRCNSDSEYAKMGFY